MTVVAVILVFSVAAGVFLVWHQFWENSRRQTAASSQSASREESGQEQVEEDKSFQLTLAGPNHPLSSGYRPELEEFSGISVDRRILPSLKKMMEGASAAGCPLVLTGGYVDAARQEALFQAEANRLIKLRKISLVLAESEAQSTVGRGGQHDAQTGLSVLFTSGGKEKNFGSTPQFRWLAQNCVNYGFIERYPPDKAAKTGMSGDVARYRYVGEENAVKMRELSMCLEEYVSYLEERDTD